jgi:hypothetical protein
MSSAPFNGKAPENGADGTDGVDRTKKLLIDFVTRSKDAMYIATDVNAEQK